MVALLQPAPKTMESHGIPPCLNKTPFNYNKETQILLLTFFQLNSLINNKKPFLKTSNWGPAEKREGNGKAMAKILKNNYLFTYMIG